MNPSMGRTGNRSAERPRAGGGGWGLVKHNCFTVIADLSWLDGNASLAARDSYVFPRRTQRRNVNTMAVSVATRRSPFAILSARLICRVEHRLFVFV